jgi:D-3-phosphoglycerate dehydrogenase / 2-oxoglutarate reductase
MIGFGRPGAIVEGWPTLGAGSTERLPVLAVGDRFVPAALLGARLAAHGQPHGLAFDLHEVDLPYPTAAAIPLPDDPPSGRIRAFWEEIDAIAARLQADEADPGLREYTGPVDRLVPLIGDAEVLLVHAAPVSRAAVRAAGALRVVGTVRGGTVNLNLDALSERGIPVFNTPGRNAQAVAEFVAGALIAHLRGIVAGATALHDGRWSMGPWTVDGAGMELAGKTCGIVGFGQVARAFTPIARGIGMRLLATDPWVDPAEVERAGVEPVGLDELLRRADVVALMARYDGDNRHLIDAAALARMRPTAVLVNTARPQLVDTEALRAALRERRIAGAIVDVFDQEPPAGDDELLGLPGTLLTPHIAGASRDTVVRGADLLGARVVQHLVDGDLRGAANLAAIQLAAERE